MKDGKFLTMAIESSCDETAIAVVADGRTVLSNVISSQIDIFKQYGGVVPEIASRHHLENINGVLQQALDEAGVGLAERCWSAWRLPRRWLSPKTFRWSACITCWDISARTISKTPH